MHSRTARMWLFLWVACQLGGCSGGSSLISTFTASPSQVNYGETTTLSWTLSGTATSLTLDGVSVLGESSHVVSPVRRQTFVLAASHSLDSDTRKVTVAAQGLDLLAGNLAGSGSLDGTGSAARFNRPSGVAVDGSGNVYVADVVNNTIRKITAAGVVGTLAGLVDAPGSADGTGSAARFTSPQGVAVDGSGNLYVADTENHTIRRVTAAGVVSTLAGLAGMPGSIDGTGSLARFSFPRSVAADGSGNLYVADTQNHTIRKVTSAGMVSTLAGLAGMPGSIDGTGSTARFRSPQGLAADNFGNVYVADTENHTIRIVTSAGVVSTLAGLAGMPGSADGTGSTARLLFPSGAAVDGFGNVYVGDTINSTVRKITSAGVVTTLAGLAGMPGSADGTGSAARFNRPSSVAVDGSGNAFVGDTNNNTVRKVTSAGVVSTLAGLAGTAGIADGTGSAARFSFPTAVAVDGSGSVYIADTGNNTIRSVTSAGAVTTLAGMATARGSADGTGSTARFDGPRGMAVDGSGNVYVAETFNSTIRKITSAGVVSTLAGSAGVLGSTDGTGSAAHFYRPEGVAVDASGNVYVADTLNYTIRKITSAGMVSTLAGLAGMGGSADGTGSAARFFQPEGIAVDASGNVYVADEGNGTIRKITAAGVVSTLAGLEGMEGSADGTGSAARFDEPFGVAVDGSGNVYVADSGNHTIRKVTAAGVVTTIAGRAGSLGTVPGPLPATLYLPFGIALAPAGDLIVTTSNGVAQITAF